ncbi:MAG TPA: sulfur carrier protein ThiS [Candidatus Methanomethylophilaceae archaeon]|nr:sulfur carrier protein ThiS [Candidatus Methanomethylophilaceae archaeon]
MIVNGKKTEIEEGTTLERFLIGSEYDILRIAVELNGRIVPRFTYGQVVLKDSDSMEIVSFVGGG